MFDFRASGTAIDVYAGLITPDLRVLELITSADLAIFCSQWTASLLSHPMNALPGPWMTAPAPPSTAVAP